MNYYNDNDPFAASWLQALIDRRLIPQGYVDQASITEVSADDLSGFTQCHFFAGIAGWSEALRLAGWPEDRRVWTGSCPCQPFSAAGKRKGSDDARHLWPDWFRLIRESRPDYLFGEQVEGAIGHGWLDGVFGDLEGEGYTCGSAVLGAHSVRAPHIRQRLYWVGKSNSTGSFKGEHASSIDGWSSFESASGRLANAGQIIGGRGESFKLPRITGTPIGLQEAINDKRGGSYCGLANSCTECADELPIGSSVSRGGAWGDYIVIPCADGKSRRLGVRPAPMVDGLSGQLDGGREVRPIEVLAQKETNRIGLLRGYGNSIVPQVAAEFIRAFMEIEGLV